MQKTIAILGVGQLAQMLAIPAMQMGCKLIFWQPQGAESVVQNLGLHYLEGEHAFAQFAEEADIILFDHEHVADYLLDELETNYCAKAPGLKLLKIARDRALEKALFSSLAIRHATQIPIDGVNEQTAFPLVIKQRFGGYDGKGQTICYSKEEFEQYQQTQGLTDKIIEQFIPFAQECSLVTVVDAQGGCHAYDVSLNKHADGILIESCNSPQAEFYQQALQYNRQVAQHCGYKGTFAIEYFVLDGQLFANEISPRVHNSGHWTLDGAYHSQFENHVRACLDLSIGDTTSFTLIKMQNLIGGHFDESAQLRTLDANSRLYWYGKQSKPQRKLGHINIRCD